MRLKMSIAFVTALTANVAFAEGTTYGIGVGFNDGIKIYLPINTEDWFIEPTLYMYDSSEKSSPFGDQKYEQSRLEVGVGLFKDKIVMEDTHLYYGARVGYSNYKYENTYSADNYFSRRKNKEDGYFIAPTIGMNYLISPRISVGLDVSLSHSRTKGTNNRVYRNDTDPLVEEISDTESKYSSTRTSIILRYSFN